MFHLPCNSSLCLLHTFITHFLIHVAQPSPWGFLFLFNKHFLDSSLVRINIFSKFYFNLWHNYFLGTSLSLIFDFVFISLFGDNFLCPFYFSVVSFNFPPLHWIQCSVILINKVIHVSSFYFNSWCLQGFLLLLEIIPYICVLVLWYHIHENLTLSVYHLQSSLLGGSVPLQLPHDSCPAVFWKEKDWCTNDEQLSTAHKKLHPAIEEWLPDFLFRTVPFLI